jgi:hypothetical protein
MSVEQCCNVASSPRRMRMIMKSLRVGGTWMLKSALFVSTLDYLVGPVPE